VTSKLVDLSCTASFCECKEFLKRGRTYSSACFDPQTRNSRQSGDSCIYLVHLTWWPHGVSICCFSFKFHNFLNTKHFASHGKLVRYAFFYECSSSHVNLRWHSDPCRLGSRGLSKVFKPSTWNALPNMLTIGIDLESYDKLRRWMPRLGGSSWFVSVTGMWFDDGGDLAPRWILGSETKLAMPSRSLRTWSLKDSYFEIVRFWVVSAIQASKRLLADENGWMWKWLTLH
jgi:hypothetical protein